MSYKVATEVKGQGSLSSQPSPLSGKQTDEIYLQIKYSSLRNISGLNDKRDNRQHYAGKAIIKEVALVEHRGNVRGYLARAKKPDRPSYTGVHRAMLDTLSSNPSQFDVLNGGIVFTCTETSLDDKNKTITLKDPGLENGAQTKGVIEDFLSELEDSFPVQSEFKFEIISTSDEDLRTEIGISRNLQNPVKNLSIEGNRGYLDELEEAMLKFNPKFQIAKSETDLGVGIVTTEKLIQVLEIMTPEKIWLECRSDAYRKNNTYKSKAGALKSFVKYYKMYKGDFSDFKSNLKDDKKNELTKKASELIKFYYDICGPAWEAYIKYQTSNIWKNSGIVNGIKRNKNGKILGVNDGLLFPLMAGFSVCIDKNDDKKWIVDIRSDLEWSEIMKELRQCYVEIGKRSPMDTGRSNLSFHTMEREFSKQLEIIKLKRQLAVAQSK